MTEGLAMGATIRRCVRAVAVIGLLAALASPRARGSSLLTLVDFVGTNGAYPYAGLIMDDQGNLYGTVSVGIPNPGRLASTKSRQL
jgi:hypothetical protein